MLFGRYASQKSEAKYPDLWDGLRHIWCPQIQSPSGLTVYDFGRRNLHGTLTLRAANVAWTRGSLGNSMLFAGSNTNETTSTQGRIIVPQDIAVDRTGFSFWIQPSSLSKRGICGSGPLQTNPRFAITLLTTGQLEVFRGANTTSTAVVTAGAWHHCFVWNDGSNTSYWINGRFSNSAAQTITQLLQAQFFIGSNFWGAFDGQIAEFAVYDRLPSVRSIRRLASAPGVTFAAKRDVNYGSSGNRRRRLLIGASS